MENSAIPVRSRLKMFANPAALCWQIIRNLFNHCLVILLREKSTQLALRNMCRLKKRVQTNQIPLCSHQGDSKAALLHRCVRVSDWVRTWCYAVLSRCFPGGRWLLFPGAGSRHSMLSSALLLPVVMSRREWELQIAAKSHSSRQLRQPRGTERSCQGYGPAQVAECDSPACRHRR